MFSLQAGDPAETSTEGLMLSWYTYNTKSSHHEVWLMDSVDRTPRVLSASMPQSVSRQAP